MARKPLGPNDVNEYYKAMGARPEAQAWEMPIYNSLNGKPITGQARSAPKKSGSFVAPVYNNQGKPIINENVSDKNQNGDPMYRVEVYRPGIKQGQQFKAPKYNNAGKPIINSTIPESGSGNLYRPSELKKSGVPIPLARQETVLAMGENKKLYLNNSFSIYAPMPIGSFTKVSGMETEWELESYHEGGDNGSEHYFPKHIKNSNLVFEYGTGLLDPLVTWFNMSNLGMMVKFPLLVFLTNELKIPVKMWMVMDAMPVKYSAPHFDAMVSEVAINRLELIHIGLINVF